MAIYAIGDLLGGYEDFMELLDQCSFDPDKDQLWLTGNLVNGGSQSLEVLRFVKSLRHAAVTVLGHHDLHLLEVYARAGPDRGENAWREVMAAPDLDVLMDWLRHRPLLHRQGDYLLVNAGLMPQWTPAQAAILANRVEEKLREQNFGQFLLEVNHTDADEWRDDLPAIDKMRVTVNAMMRLQFLDPKGRIDFTYDVSPEEAPAGYTPWFAAPGRKSQDAVVTFGHWSAVAPRIEPNLIAVGAGRRSLSAVRLDDGQLFQLVPTSANAQGQARI